MNTTETGQPLAVLSSEELGLAPERTGQPRMMTIIDGERDEETGHWYSPAAVRELLAAERELCTKVCRDLDSTGTEPTGEVCAMAISALLPNNVIR